MEKLKEAITNWWGERCPENAPACPCCIAWAEYDALTTKTSSLDAALRSIIDRSTNGELGTSKVIDMRRIAETALSGPTP